MILRWLALFALFPLFLTGCQTAQLGGTTSNFVGPATVGAPVQSAEILTNDAANRPVGETPPATTTALSPTTIPTPAQRAVNEAATRPVGQVAAVQPTHTVVNEATRAPVEEVSDGIVRKTAKKKKRSGRITVAEGRRRYKALIAKYARANNVPVNLAMAVVEVESSYRRSATGGAGEIGLMQLLPRTARYIGYKGSMKALYNPDTNIRWGMKYLGKARRLSNGTTCGTILKYNAGHGAKKMNPISARYCKRIARIMRKT